MDADRNARTMGIAAVCLLAVTWSAFGQATQGTSVLSSHITPSLAVSSSGLYPTGAWNNQGPIDGVRKNQSTVETTGYHSSTNVAAQWWAVDLGSEKVIGGVQVVNRKDYTTRLTNFKIVVSNETEEVWCGLLHGNTSVGRGEWVSIVPPVTGRHVRVEQLTNTAAVLTLMEVNVTRYANVAYGGTASQSTTASGGSPARAIDGCEDGTYNNRSVSHTDNVATQPIYWEVDLGGDCDIEEIVLYNRLDGEALKGRLSNFRVSVFDDSREVYGENFYEVAGNVDELLSLSGAPVEVRGDRVRVSLLGVNRQGSYILSLAEVQVFGTRIQGAIEWGAPFSMNSTDPTLVLNDWDMSRNGGRPRRGGNVVVAAAVNRGYSNVVVNGISFTNLGGSTDFWGHTGINNGVDRLLSGHQGGGDTFPITLGNLTSGELYQLQLIGIHDTRAGSRVHQYEVGYGGNDYVSRGPAPVLTRHGYGNVNPPNPPTYDGQVSYCTVVGTFEAGSSSMTFNLRRNMQDDKADDDGGCGYSAYVLLHSLKPVGSVLVVR